jgi:hypothetical protein
MRDFIEKQRINGYNGFKGAIIRGSIPVKQEVINDIIQETVLRNSGLIRHMQLTVQDQNRIDVNLTIQKWILSKSFNLELYIEREINFPSSPTINIWLPASQKVLGSIAEIVTNLVGFFPASVKVTGRLIEINLKVLLQQQKMGELVQFIKFAEIEGQRGKILLNFRLEVD